MRIYFRKLGFTLMEVNLAVFIMAVGVLAMVSLYPLGYRENQQSIDDVKAAAYADAVFNQISGVLSSRSLTWNEWEQSVQSAVNVTGAAVHKKGGAWMKYCDSGRGYAPRKKGEVNGLARSVFSSLTGKASNAGGSASWPVDGDLACALVAQWGVVSLGKGSFAEDHSRVVVSMRVSRVASSLFAQPMFLAEIHFQGDQKEAPNAKKK